MAAALPPRRPRDAQPHIEVHELKSKLTAFAAAAAMLGAFATPALANQTVLVTLSYVSGVGSTTQQGSFSSTVATAGSFIDDYIFTSPPAVATDIFTGTAGTGAAAGITFTSAVLYYFGAPPTVANALGGTFTGTSFNETAAGLVTSGVYELEIQGTSLGGTSAYTGLIKATTQDLAPSVPEPATWAMWLLGLGATGAALRRRRGQAA